MTVIKFVEDISKETVYPGGSTFNGNARDAVLKYAKKTELPKYAETYEFFLTTDTHELYKGNGKSIELVLMNTILMYDNVSKFPTEGSEYKLYLDRTSLLLFIWEANAYKAVGGAGGGNITIAPSDGKIGDLTALNTTNKSDIVEAINEVIGKIPVINMSALQTSISNLQVEVNSIRSSIGTLNEAALESIRQTIGKLPDLSTSNKTSIVRAINEIRSALIVVEGKVDSVEVDLTPIYNLIGQLVALKTTTKASVVSAINELFDLIGATKINTDNLTTLMQSVRTDLSTLSGKVATNTTDINTNKNKIASVETSVTNLTTSTTNKFTAVDQRLATAETDVDNLEVRVTGIETVNLTAADKVKYEEYRVLVLSLLNEANPELQGRVLRLEQQVAALIGGGAPIPEEVVVNPEHPVLLKKPSDDPRPILWEHEFVLPIGVFDYDLSADPNYAGKSFGEDEIAAEPVGVRVFYLGTVGGITDNAGELPFVGDVYNNGPTRHDKWDTNTFEDLIFKSGELTAMRYKLVKYDIKG